MIPLKEYSKEFEKEYFNIINKKVDGEKKKDIIKSSKEYLPSDFYSSKDEFRDLILAPYEKLKRSYLYIKEAEHYECMRAQCFVEKENQKDHKIKHELNELNQYYFKSYDAIIQSLKKGEKLSVKIVRESGIYVCPYCNRDYINCRDDKIAGAQMDHFYNRSSYPIFALSLYNLIPSCGICNLIKSTKENLISPFDENIDFENAIKFSYEPINTEIFKISIKAEHGLENNIKELKLEEAYLIHSNIVKELIQKSITFNKTQREEMLEMMLKLDITNEEFKEAIWGKTLESSEFGKRTLAKLEYDIINCIQNKCI